MTELILHNFYQQIFPYKYLTIFESEIRQRVMILLNVFNLLSNAKSLPLHRILYCFVACFHHVHLAVSPLTTRTLPARANDINLSGIYFISKILFKFM